VTDLKEKSPENIVLRFVWLESLTQDYTNEEIGQLIRDLYSYASKGTEPQQYADRGMRGLWRSMKDGVDKDFFKYQEKSQKAAASANARWSKAVQGSVRAEMQSNANASEKMQTHLTECAGLRSHRTSTCTNTNTATVTSTPEISASTASASEIDSDLAEIVQRFQRVIGELPPSAFDKLQRWREVYPAEIICKAFDEAAESGHRSWKYVDSILKGWQTDGVRTLGDVEARREARKKPEEALKCERKLAT
jgi:DnaD/phage-associated family protein